MTAVSGLLYCAIPSMRPLFSWLLFHGYKWAALITRLISTFQAGGRGTEVGKGFPRNPQLMFYLLELTHGDLDLVS